MRAPFLVNETQRPGLTQVFQKLVFICAPDGSWFLKDRCYSHHLPLFIVSNLLDGELLEGRNLLFTAVNRVPSVVPGTVDMLFGWRNGVLVEAPKILRNQSKKEKME